VAVYWVEDGEHDDEGEDEHVLSSWNDLDQLPWIFFSFLTVHGGQLRDASPVQSEYWTWRSELPVRNFALKNLSPGE
jgi:hypothetical protein